jgi:hypothetical protein
VDSSSYLGAGWTDGRVPHNTRVGLADGDLHTALSESAKAVLTNNVPTAGESEVNGSGESYATKWLWALGLASICQWDDDHPQPLILDYRVRRCLGWIAAYEIDKTAERSKGTPSGHQAYLEYCLLLRSVSESLRGIRPNSHIDPEKVEWLLFSGTDGEYIPLIWMDPSSVNSFRRATANGSN